MGNERFIFGFWESPTTGWHAYKVKKHFHCLICIYLLPHMLNDSQTIRSTILFPNPSFACSHFHFITPDKAEFVRQCCFVYSVTGETAILTPLKAAPSGKEWICIFIQTNRKDQQVRWQYTNLGFILKTTLINDSESTLSFERQHYTRCTFRFKTLQDVFIHLELCYTLHWNVIFKNP